MRLGIRTAISPVPTSIVVSAVGVHSLWRTAHQVSQTLANTINDQIVSAVGDELQSVTTEARSSMMAVRTLLAEKVFEPRDARKREVVFRSQLLSQPTISWVAFGWPDGSFFAGHKAGDGVIEMLEITPDRKLRTRPLRIRRGRSSAQASHVEDTKYSVTDQEWFRTAIETNDELWATFTTHPKASGWPRLRRAHRSTEAGRRHRHHHRTDAGVEFPVAAHGRKPAGAFILERNGKWCPARSERQRGGGAENRSSAVSDRGRGDPERQRLRTRRRTAVHHDGDAGRQGLSGRHHADFVSGLVAGDGGAESEFLAGADDDPELLIGLAVLIVFADCCRHGLPSA